MWATIGSVASANVKLSDKSTTIEYGSTFSCPIMPVHPIYATTCHSRIIMSMSTEEY